MKSKLYMAVAAFACAVSFSSCSDWFDISPKTDVKAEELFETESGYFSALAGIYVSMTEPTVYGGNLSFGMLDHLAQIYDVIPLGANDKTAVYEYKNESHGGYNTKGKQAQTWLKSYNLIANANNLLKWIEMKGATVVPNEQTRNMLKGEALAIRAYVHFDLLRCWGPINYKENVEGREMKCIPYRVVTDNSKQPLQKASDVVAKVIADLQAAKECLSYEKNLNLDLDKNRRFRFNYHAVVATLARVYNYAGDKQNAIACADEVIKNSGLELQNNNFKDPVLFKEMICGLNMYKMEEELSSQFGAGEKITEQYYTNFSTMNLIFQTVGTESDDMRAKTSAFVQNTDEQKAISKKYTDNKNEAIPLIRLPEMYYIKSESSSLEDGAAYLNLIRNKRGLSTSTNVKFTDENARKEALSAEYRKEFYAEGKYFYFMKHIGFTGTLTYSPTITMVNEYYLFPLPDNEKEYGWTADEEPEEENVVE